MTRRKLATAQQLWTLNGAGLLREALDEDGRAWADTCWQRLAELRAAGGWRPRQNRQHEPEPETITT